MCSNRALPAQVPVLQVVDELEALSWWSEYYEARSNAVRARVRFRVRFFAAARRAQVTGTFTRKRLLAAQLRVAAAVREMTAPMARGAYLAAVSASGGVSPRVRLEGVPEGAARTLDGYAAAEAEAMLQHYLAPKGLALGEAELPLRAQRMRLLTAGSGTQLRHAALMAADESKQWAPPTPLQRAAR